MRYLVKINGKQFDVEIDKIGAGSQPMYAAPQAAPVYAQPQQAAPVYAQAPQAAPAPAYAAPQAAPAGGGAEEEVVSPMPGSIFDIQVTVGQQVASGQVLVVLEAMKMENEIVAPCAGTVKQILVSKGATVDTNDVLVVLN